MYENEIIQLIEKLDDSAKKEIFDFVLLIDHRHEINTTDNNKSEKDKLEKLAGIFKKYSKPEWIERESELAWENHLKQKFSDNK